MTLEGAITEIQKWELPFYSEPSRAKVLETVAELAKNYERVIAERDKAIYELKHLNDNCFCCKWWNENVKQLSKCQSPEPCCVDGNPDRWEWRGVQNDSI